MNLFPDRSPWARLGVCLLGTGLVAGSLAGCGRKSDASAAGRSIDHAPAPAHHRHSRRGPVPVAVQTVTPRRQTWEQTVTRPGYVEAEQKVRLYAKAAGYLRTFGTDLKGRPVDVGSPVRKGQVLAELEIPEMKSALEQKQALLERAGAQQSQARAAVAAAQATVQASEAKVKVARSTLKQSEAQYQYAQSYYERIRGLAQRNAAPSAKVDETYAQMTAAGAAVDAARDQLVAAQAGVLADAAKEVNARADVEGAAAQVKVAAANLDYQKALMEYLTIRAPFDGVVTRRTVDVGAFIQDASKSLGQHILTLSNIYTVRIFIDIPEREIRYLDTGDPATFRIDLYAGETFPGQVARFPQTLDPASRSVRAEVDLPNPHLKLMPGMYGSLTVVLDRRPNVLTLPDRALVQDENQISVLAVVNGKAHRTPIQIGGDNGNWVEVVSGLAGAEKVITVGKSDVREGDAVIAVPEEHPQAGLP